MAGPPRLTVPHGGGGAMAISGGGSDAEALMGQPGGLSDLRVRGEPEARASGGSYEYDGFVSYRHSEREKAIARKIQEALHRFARPFWKLRAVRLYRDETNLSARPDLWGTIAQALDASRFFLLMASPEAASSKWVGREVEHWLHRRGTAGLIIVRADGSVMWDGESRRFNAAHTTALPAPLLERLDTEPLYVDLAWIDKPELQLVMSNPRF